MKIKKLKNKTQTWRFLYHFEDKEIKKSRALFIIIPKNLDDIFLCQDTEIQVVVVGAGRADLVAQTKAHRLFFRMEAQNSDSWR